MRLFDFDRELVILLGGLGVMLVVATIAARVLAHRLQGEQHRSLIDNLTQRINAWWVMIGVITVALACGRTVTICLFLALSFLGLREFITISPTVQSDHRVLLWVFFIVTPLHYWFLFDWWYGMFAVMIPVYAFLLLPTRNAIVGKTDQFLTRSAVIQWSLMVCVYSLSHAAALLNLGGDRTYADRAKLLVFLLIVAQGSDVLQYIWGKSIGRVKIVPTVSPNKTVEGFVGGILSSTLVGTLLWWATPFSPWQAASMSLLIGLMGFAGGLVLSAIKRDRGVKDFGTLIAGHGGVLDRVDSLCFAAPVFFHLTRYHFGV